MPDKDKKENVSQIDLMKALVDHALGGDVHPDQRATLESWRDQHTSEQEKYDRLTDDERAALSDEERERYTTGDTADTTADTGDTSSPKEQPGAEGASRTPDQPKSGTKK